MSIGLNYIILAYWMHIVTIECTCAFPVSLISGQLFGVKKHTVVCMSLFSVCYCTNLILIQLTTQYIDISAIQSSQ